MNTACTIYKTADFIGKRWTLLILLELYKGEQSSRRYGQLKESLPGITAKMLSERLKELEKQGMVKKEIDAESMPVRCDYTLTKSGAEFVDVIKQMKEWALKWKFDNKKCESTECENCKF